MIRRMRFFRIFVLANVRNGAVGADGKPARAKLKEYRSREARKRQTEVETIRGKPVRAKLKGNRLREARKGQTERETICGKPEKEKLGAGGLREGREEDSQRMMLAGRPRERNLENDARGKPAESFLNV